MKPPLLFWRRGCQALIALGFIALPLFNARGISVIAGNLLSFDFFGLSVVDPLALLQTLAGGWPAPKAMAGAALALLIALLLGRVFCGWMCPYALASEIVFAISAKRRAHQKTVATLAHETDIRPFMVRAAVAGLGLFAVLLFLPAPYLNQLSMPGWYTRALQHAAFFGLPLYGALLFPALLLLEGFTGNRFWCRYLCPQSVLLSLFAALPWLGLRLCFVRKQCGCAQNDRACLAACSLALNPRKITLAHRLGCTNCGDCVDVCRSRGRALRLSFRPFP
ncbi:MAG: 4Fe-4S binding protein [Desulfobulbus sp.]|nr:4Fe-4S binding protein [Desulfobulbus sp.]